MVPDEGHYGTRSLPRIVIDIGGYAVDQSGIQRRTLRQARNDQEEIQHAIYDVIIRRRASRFERSHHTARK
jgi:hypothetical protein